MLATSLPNAARRFAAAAALWLGAAACSTLPDAGYPPFAEHHLQASFTAGADGRVPVPQSRADLVVRELHAAPAPRREEFAAGQRWLLYAPGTAVLVRCRLRAYAAADGRLPAPAQLLPGAASVRELPPP